MLALALATAAFAIHPGDRVVFYGDSISEHQRYTAYAEAYVRCHYPDLDARFSSAGWAGDTIYGTTGWDEAGGTTETRVSRDVTPRRPTLVTVMLGMNDAYYSPFHEDWLAAFVKGYGHLLDLIRQGSPQARLCLFGPTPWDDFTRAPSFPQSIQGTGGYNATLVKYSEAIGQIARRRGLAYVDLNAPFATALARAAKEDPKLAQSLIPDWIHPDWSGALIAGAAVVKGWGAPDTVASVSIDVASRAAECQGTAVRNVGPTSWEQKDGSLPFPFDPKDAATALAARSCDLSSILDRYPFRVTGLAEGRYELSIDGQKVGVLTSAQLASGVDLGAYDTPMRRNAASVLALVKEKNNAQLARWRQIERPFDGKYKSAKRAEAAIDALVEEIEKRVREEAKPRWRRYELKPA